MTILPASAVKLLIYEPNLGHEDQLQHIKHTHLTNTVPDQDSSKIWDNSVTELPKNDLFLEDGNYLKASLGDDLKGYHLAAFYFVKGFNNFVCGTDTVYLLLWE